VHQNAPFQGAKFKKISGEGAQPPPQTHPYWERGVPLPRPYPVVASGSQATRSSIANSAPILLTTLSTGCHQEESKRKPPRAERLAYISLVRSTMEYPSAVWDQLRTRIHWRESRERQHVGLLSHERPENQCDSPATSAELGTSGTGRT